MNILRILEMMKVVEDLWRIFLDVQISILDLLCIRIHYRSRFMIGALTLVKRHIRSRGLHVMTLQVAQISNNFECDSREL